MQLFLSVRVASYESGNVLGDDVDKLTVFMCVFSDDVLLQLSETNAVVCYDLIPCGLFLLCCEQLFSSSSEVF